MCSSPVCEERFISSTRPSFGLCPVSQLTRVVSAPFQGVLPKQGETYSERKKKKFKMCPLGEARVSISFCCHCRHQRTENAPRRGMANDKGIRFSSSFLPNFALAPCTHRRECFVGTDIKPRKKMRIFFCICTKSWSAITDGGLFPFGGGVSDAVGSLRTRPDSEAAESGVL